jgi:hypothetical protein
MSATNIGTITGTIVSEIKERVITDALKVVEFRIKPVGASDEDSPLPMTAYNGVGQNILARYNHPRSLQPGRYRRSDPPLALQDLD